MCSLDGTKMCVNWMGRRAVSDRTSVASVGNESAGVHTSALYCFQSFSYFQLVINDESPTSDGIYLCTFINDHFDSKLYGQSLLLSYPFAFSDPTSVHTYPV